MCIREADILEKQWQETMESKSSSPPDEQGKEQGTPLMNCYRKRDVREVYSLYIKGQYVQFLIFHNFRSNIEIRGGKHRR